VNWGTIIVGAALTALALINEQTHWLLPLTFAAVAIAVLLIVVAPRPAWVALVIAGIGAFGVRSVSLAISGLFDDPCVSSGIVCGGTQPGWYRSTDLFGHGYTNYLVELPFIPAWVIVAGVLGWAIRRRSWRTAVAGAVYGAAVATMEFDAPIVLFAAAAAALGPRKDARYLAGLGILALALIDQQGPWTLITTIVAITVTLALLVWALFKKDGVNGTVALVALAAASLTPFLSAGVLLAASLVKRRAWFGLAAAAAVIGWALLTQQPTTTRMQWLSQDQVPVQSSRLSAPGLLIAATAISAVAAMTIRRRAARSAGTPNR
jgi:hypothetical protein